MAVTKSGKAGTKKGNTKDAVNTPDSKENVSQETINELASKSEEALNKNLPFDEGENQERHAKEKEIPPAKPDGLEIPEGMTLTEFFNQKVAEAVGRITSQQYETRPITANIIDPNAPLPYDPEDILLKPVSFFAYNVGTCLFRAYKASNGADVKHPYNREVTFEHYFTEIKKGTREDRYTQYCHYVCHSIRELAWIRKHPEYGLSFEEIKDLGKVDDSEFLDRQLAVEQLKNMPDIIVRERFNRAFHHFLPDHNQMRIQLIPTLVEEIKKQDKLNMTRQANARIAAEKFKTSPGAHLIGPDVEQ